MMPSSIKILKNTASDKPYPILADLINQAWLKRLDWFGPNAAFRLVHGTSDGLPDTFIDYLHGLAIVQTHSEASDESLSCINQALQTNKNVHTIMIANDSLNRQVRGLTLHKALITGFLPKTFCVQESFGTYLYDAFEAQSLFPIEQRPLRSWLAQLTQPPRKALILGSRPEWLFDKSQTIAPCITPKPIDQTLTGWAECLRKLPPGKHFDLIVLCLPARFCDQRHQTGLGHILQGVLSRAQNEAYLMTQSQSDISKLGRQISGKNCQTLTQLNRANSGPDFPTQSNGSMNHFFLYRLMKY